MELILDVPVPVADSQFVRLMCIHPHSLGEGESIEAESICRLCSER